MNKPNKHQTLHVLNATHWDREWILSFVNYRRLLIHYTDQLLEIMSRDPSFKYYHMDAQVICMEDYLKMRPEKTGALKKLVKNKRIFVGPWYSLPDMPLLHGEALARNLLIGIGLSKSLGGVMLEGYTPCSNGQIAQLPQLYAGFNIHSAIIYKGIAGDRMPKEFIWRSPDGSEVLTIHLAARYGRGNFYCLLYHEVVANVIHDTPVNNWDYALKENWMPFRIAFNHHDPYVYTSLNCKEAWHAEHLQPYLQKLRDQTADGAATSHLIGFNGMDHTPPFPATPKLIAAANKVFPDLRVIDSNIPAVMAAIRGEADKAKLPVHLGELRDAKAVAKDRDMYWPTLSARLGLKIANRETEHLLIDLAEPASTWAWLRGMPYPAPFLTEAWKLLLANHAHDSIDGCSLNKVTDDILGRFFDCQTICEGMLQDACVYLLTRPGQPAAPKTTGLPDPYLAIFNPTPYARGGFIETEVDIPNELAGDHFCLQDEKGKTIAPDIRFLHPCSASLSALVGRPIPAKRYRFQFEADAIPPMAWRSFKVVRKPPAAVLPAPSLAPADRVLENDFLKVTVNNDGTLDMLDKNTGKNYRGLHGFEDIGDTGDPWHFKPAGEPVDPRLPTHIARVENTPWRAAIEVRMQWELPKARPPSAPGGTPERALVAITSRFSLTRSARRLDVQTTIDNPCRDHRLRVCFPTGLVSESTYAGGQYHVDERPTRLPDMSKWIEPVDGYPNFGFAGLSDGKTGLSILNIGLPEYFIKGADRNILTLTILRATQLKKWPESAGDVLSAGAQCLGQQTVRYAIYPHAGNWQMGRVLQEYRSFAVPLIKSEIIGAPCLCRESALITLSPDNLEVACVKRAERENSLVIRVWNPSNRPQPGKVALGIDFKSVVAANLNENPEDGAAIRLKRVGKRAASFTVPPQRIVTLLFRGVKGVK